jgi:hypothetical protein
MSGNSTVLPCPLYLPTMLCPLLSLHPSLTPLAPLQHSSNIHTFSPVLELSSASPAHSSPIHSHDPQTLPPRFSSVRITVLDCPRSA